MPVVEFLSYILAPGTGGAFHHIMTTRSLPLHAAHGIDVVAAGPSAEADRYLLIRVFPDLAGRDTALAAFYAHPDWRQGPRADIVAAIESAVPVVISLDDDGVQALRRLF